MGDFTSTRADTGSAEGAAAGGAAATGGIGIPPGGERRGSEAATTIGIGAGAIPATAATEATALLTRIFSPFSVDISIESNDDSSSISTSFFT